MQITDYGFLVCENGLYLHIIYYDEALVRFVYCNSKSAPAPSVAVIARPVKLQKSVNGNMVLASRLKIEVNRKTLALKIYDHQGTLFSKDLSVDPARPALKKKLLWEEGIYGNGEKYSWLNQLGLTTENYNTDVLLRHDLHSPLIKAMHTAIPFYIGAAPGKAYGIYFDNTFKTTFDFAAHNSSIISLEAAGGLLDYYYIHGPSIAEVTERYSRLTGTAGLPRKKFLGYQQSRYSYENEAEVLEIARKMRANKIPCDVIYLDIAYLEAYKVFTINKERFPAFQKMLKELKQMGFAVVVIVNPGVKVEESYQVYRTGLENDYFVKMPTGQIYQGQVWPGEAVFPDFFQPAVRKWWGAFHRELLALGVEGIWNDMNEPSDFSSPTGTVAEEALHKTGDGRLISHREGHNLYGLLQTKATSGALKKYQPGLRPFVLTRATFAGGQRYAALWTGDNASIWQHLESSLPMLLNLGLSSFSFAGADVGGYRGDCSGELLVRWTQAGAFIPFFRNHSETGTAYQEPWRFEEQELAIMRTYIRLRYQFLTYLYNLMRESHLSGAPVMRPLLYHYQGDRRVYNISDQFLLGEALLVCPVLKPGATCRLIYLPDGLWHDFWSKEVLEGGRFIVREAPLELMPLYIKAGSIVPFERFEETGSGIKHLGLEMHCYLGHPGCYRLYLDDGESFNYQQGAFSEIKFTMSADPIKPVIETAVLQEGYPLPEIKIITHRAVK